MKRRTFVRASSITGAGSLWGGSAFAGSMFESWFGRRADLVLRGAMVYDGTGSPGREVDVAITGDRITEVGLGVARGETELDVRGLALAPGFIDIHSHADTNLLINNKAESRIRQGVTLEVVGQDRGSIGPWSDGEFEATRDRFRGRGVEVDYRDPAGFVERGVKGAGAAR